MASDDDVSDGARDLAERACAFVLEDNQGVNEDCRAQALVKLVHHWHEKDENHPVDDHPYHLLDLLRSRWSLDGSDYGYHIIPYHDDETRGVEIGVYYLFA
jgi:hypothetical protein